MRRTARESLREALDALGEAHGQSLDPDVHGVITIELADDVLCSLEAPEVGDHLYVHAPVLRLPQVGGGAGMIERALARNAFELTMATAWLALDRESRSIMLCAGFPAADLSSGSLEDILIAVHRQVLSERAALAGGSAAVSDDTLLTKGEVIIRA